ncbi:hypothetical protein ACTOB_008422 [Actinoplanes oblitus]|uniref:SnoaL-like domain-containing protein n=1 Tax=Actinoplanes oblitus TaxID=3040509 RepID=A0ABY8WEI2_9ACTN|nr:hypothetical protein [Actinoplanes oblitus]WIM96246.1 hypothetical protein ACTOB_008422 [Actinoplanes oblitus]
MQPLEPEFRPGPMPSGLSAVPGAGVGGGGFKSRRTRLWLALGAGILAVLCLGGVGVVVSLYDNATKVERTDPSVVLDAFLGAFLVYRDDRQLEEYACKTGGNFSQLGSFRDGIQQAESKHSVEISITWRNVNASVSGERAVATAEVVRTVAGGSEETVDVWEFGMVNDGGWRVCSATPGR